MHALEDTLGYVFSNISLLHTALTHTSYASEQKNVEHNERLEFLGDAVLDLAISSHLFTLFPQEREGILTKMRASVVNASFLALLAKELGIQRYIALGKGEELQGGRERESILSDTFEAIIGAIYLDSDYPTVEKWIVKLFTPHTKALLHRPHIKDAKTILQEYTQKLFQTCPTYHLQGTDGKEHEKNFTVLLELPDTKTFLATAKSIKKAQQLCALQALEYLRERYE